MVGVVPGGARGIATGDEQRAGVVVLGEPGRSELEERAEVAVGAPGPALHHPLALGVIGERGGAAPIRDLGEAVVGVPSERPAAARDERPVGVVGVGAAACGGDRVPVRGVGVLIAAELGVRRHVADGVVGEVLRLAPRDAGQAAEGVVRVAEVRHRVGRRGHARHPAARVVAVAGLVQGAGGAGDGDADQPLACIGVGVARGGAVGVARGEELGAGVVAEGAHVAADALHPALGVVAVGHDLAVGVGDAREAPRGVVAVGERVADAAHALGDRADSAGGVVAPRLAPDSSVTLVSTPLPAPWPASS